MNPSAALEGLYDCFDNLAEGITILDPQGNILSMNRTAARLVGFPNGEPPSGQIADQHIEDLTDAFTAAGDPLPPEQRPCVLALHGRFVRNFEAGLRSKGSQEITFVEVGTAPIPGPDGEPAQIILSYREITERRRVAEARARLAAIVESSEDAIMGKDLNGMVTTWNLGAQKLFGYTSEEMIGRSIRILLLPGQEDEEDEVLRRMALGETVQQPEVSRRKKNGETVQVSVKSSPIRNHRGEVVGASKIARDITESIRAANALREGQQRLSGILDSAMDAIITVDERHRIVLFNAAAERMFLCPQSKALGRPVDEFLPARFRASHASHIRTFGATGMTSRAMGELGSLWAQRSNGEEFQIEASISQVEARGRKLFTVILRDVTDRMRAEESLREQSELLKASQTIARDMEGRIVFWSEGAQKMYGFSPKEALGAVSHELFRTEFPEPFERLEEQLQSTGRWEGELVHRRHDGETLIVSSAWILHRDSAGRPVRILESLIDVTGRKRAEEKVRQSEERFAKAFKSSPLAIAMSTVTQGRYVDVNDAFLKMLGYQANEVVGRTEAELGIWAISEQRVDLFEMLRQNGRVTSFEAQFKTKSGGSRIVNLSLEPIVLDGVECILTTGSDVTETKNLERQLHQSLKMEALGQLTGGIAHDFNNLLGVVVGNLDLLERMVAWNEAAVKRVQAAQRAAVRGAELTRRLLAFSRTEQLDPAAVDMKDAIREVVELASRTIGPEIKITTQCDANLPPVFVDTAALETALLNLALNARDAMPKGGSLILRAQLADLSGGNALVQAGELKPGQYARITVSDSGHGMPREVVDRAFEPFFTTKPRDKGTGLGLAMVYGFIKQSGGAIRLYSEVGFGTTVSLYLPLASEAAENAPEPERAEPLERLGGTALLVDDEAELLEIADAYLAELGYTVIRAGNGLEALAALERAGPIDLLVTDVIMPGKMNGIELAQRVRELRPGIKVVFTSGFPAEALAERSGKLEGGPLLHKPYQRAEFADIVRRQVSAGLR
jgi:PAS domain S-box-containing protein